jgi:hypothetical protein
VAEDPLEVGSERTLLPLFERWHRDLVEQLAKVGGLRQDLDVEERRDRLERDRRELVAAMETAR